MKRKPVDEVAIQRSRKKLREIAKEHPELTGPKGERNVKGWRETLKEDERKGKKK